MPLIYNFCVKYFLAKLFRFYFSRQIAPCRFLAWEHERSPPPLPLGRKKAGLGVVVSNSTQWNLCSRLPASRSQLPCQFDTSVCLLLKLSGFWVASSILCHANRDERTKRPRTTAFVNSLCFARMFLMERQPQQCNNGGCCNVWRVDINKVCCTVLEVHRRKKRE